MKYSIRTNYVNISNNTPSTMGSSSYYMMETWSRIRVPFSMTSGAVTEV